MKLANGIEMLEISVDVMGKPGTIYPALIWDNYTTILVDTGFPGSLLKFQEAIEASGVNFNTINKIIITHQDIDHVGSLSSIKDALLGKIEVLAHEEEKPYIEGEKCPVKLAQLETRLAVLPEPMKKVFEGMKSFYSNNRHHVDKILTDGEELPYCGGIVVIHTPGHTPGHICLYHKQSKTLIAGDSLGIENGSLIKTSSFTNYDDALAAKSLKKLSKYSIENVICYHGGLYNCNVSQSISELASK